MAPRLLNFMNSVMYDGRRSLVVNLLDEGIAKR